MRAELANSKPLLMMPEDWEKQKCNATDGHICNKSLVKDLFLDSISVYDYETGGYFGKSHKRCHCEAIRKINFFGPQKERKVRDQTDQWIANNQETCLFCTKPLLVPKHKDLVKGYCHTIGKYRGAAHNECNFKLRLNAKTVPIPVVFHNLEGYDGHLLIQAVSRVHGERTMWKITFHSLREILDSSIV